LLSLTFPLDTNTMANPRSPAAEQRPACGCQQPTVVRISAIIPAWNEQGFINACVTSVQQAGCDEILVADGGSTDRTLEILASLPCHVIQAERGRARQQNAAAQVASGDVLLFLHADARLAACATDQIRESIREGHGYGGFRQQIEAQGSLYRLLESANAWRVRRLGLPYGDQGIFVRRDLFHRVGGFPAEPLLEDLLLMKKLRKSGWPCLLSGPVYVAARRWQRHGVIRQTIRNWTILAAHRLGVSPARLAQYYALHDDR
jgi:rSAM/selenodomain-associated transferase 2